MTTYIKKMMQLSMLANWLISFFSQDVNLTLLASGKLFVHLCPQFNSPSREREKKDRTYAIQALEGSRAWNIRPELGISRMTRGSVRVPAVRAIGSHMVGLRVGPIDSEIATRSSFLGGSRIIIQQNFQRAFPVKNNSRQCAPWIARCHIASSALTLGTAAVLPFYALMTLAPNAEITRRTMESSIPQVILVALYAYISYLAWSPDMPRLLSSGEFMLPEINGITELFSSKMFISAAWLHMIVVDFFTARQIFLDGLQNKIHTQHSVAFCLFCCPLGIVLHVITKLITDRRG